MAARPEDIKRLALRSHSLAARGTPVRSARCARPPANTTRLRDLE
jgi:hypothetical protein